MTPYYDFSYSAPWYDITSIEDSLAAIYLSILPLFFGIWLLAAAVGLVLYILGGIGQMKMAEKLGVPNGWLAFIPVANIWLLGKMADFTPIGLQKQSKLRHVLLWGTVGLLALPLLLALLFIPLSLVAESAPVAFVLLILLVILVMIAAIIVLAVFEFIAVFRLYKAFDENNSTLYFALTLAAYLLLGLWIAPIFFFILGRKPYYPPYGYTYLPQNGYGQPNGYAPPYPPQNGYGYPPQNGTPYETAPSDQNPPRA